MANLRAIRNRIRSVTSTQKITKAMKMVAAARFRRAQQAVQQSRPYSRKAEELLTPLLATVSKAAHPYLTERPVQKRALVVMTSDRGLCGSFNHSILRRLEEELRDKGVQTHVVPLGKKAAQFVAKRKISTILKPEGFWTGFTYDRAAALTDELAKAFVEGGVDRVDLLYNEFVSVISQKPKLVTILPLVAPEAAGEGQAETIYEPGLAELVAALVPKMVNVRLYSACLNSLASEFGARMTAMDSATRNATEMIDRLTLHMNRARQATITNELMEIISGAEALR
jgi:F-type H+-transporting ATPase subunit gamma